MRLKWADDPAAESYQGAASAARDFAPPLVSLGAATSGQPGLLDAAPPATGLRTYRVATVVCGSPSTW